MKKKVLLVLLPALAMALGSCTGNSSDADDDDEETSQVGPGGDIDPAEFGTKDSPLTIAQAKALLDKLDPEKTGETYLGHRVYVAGKVTANDEKKNDKFSYAYIEDKTAGDFSINYFVLDSGITGDYSAKNSMKDKMVVASGFACIFNKSGEYKYELTSPKDSEEQAKIESIRDPGVSPDFNPGTEAAPLTVSQAIDQIDNHTEARTSGTADMYVAGKVKSNKAWSKGTGYSNIDFVITDGAKDFTVFRATELPGYSTAEAEAIAANDLVGMEAVVKAPAYYYSQGKIYETAANPDVLSLAFPLATSVEFNTDAVDYLAGSQIDLDDYVNLLPAGSVGTYVFDIPEGVGSFDSATNVYTCPDTAQNVEIKVKLEGASDWEDTLTITVEEPDVDTITEIDVDKSSLEFTVGDPGELVNATTTPTESSETIEWVVTGTEGIVSLESDGKQCTITPTAVGTTTVRVQVVGRATTGTDISVTVNSAATPLSDIDEAGMQVVTDAKVVYVGSNNMFIDDGTATINCYHNGGFGKSVGDLVHVEGTSSARYGGVQLSDPTVTVSEKAVTPSATVELTEANAQAMLDAYSADESAVAIPAYSRVSLTTDAVTASSSYRMWNLGSVKMENNISNGGMVAGKAYDIEGYLTDFYKSGSNKYLRMVVASAVEHVETGDITSATADNTNLTVGGATAQITCVTQGDAEATYSYSVAPEGVVSVSASGEVTPVSAGTATVTITNNYSKTATIVFNVAAAGEHEAYKLDGTIASKNEAPYNSYKDISTIEQNSLSWDVLANTAMNPWRFGGKSITNEDRTCTSNAAVTSQNVSKVVLELGDIFSNLTLNSISLYVGTSKGAKDISELSVTSAASQEKITFERPEGKDWSSRYFTVVFNVTVSVNSNNAVQMKSLSFVYVD